jgi:hypothetical protein
MPTAKRLDKHPRIVRRKKPQPVVLDDDAEAHLRMSENEYRREVFRSFVRYCRDAGAWVVSPPFERRCRVLVPDGSTILERLAELPRFPVVKIPGMSQRLTHGRFVPIIEIQVTLWRG